MFRFFKAEKRLQEVEERLEKIERELEVKDMDWLEVRARCRRLLDRTEKAARKLPDNEDPNISTHNDGADESGGGSVGTGLTARQRAIQQTILRRRGGL
jgi:chromosome segregation ATPase